LLSVIGKQAAAQGMKAYRAGKATANTAKALAGFTLVYMECLAVLEPGMNGKWPLQTAYYLWLAYKMHQTYKPKTKTEFKIIQYIPKITQYIAGLAGSTKSEGGLDHAFLSADRKGQVNTKTFIFYTGRRNRDYILSWVSAFMSGDFDVKKILEKAVSMTTNFPQKGARQWLGQAVKEAMKLIRKRPGGSKGGIIPGFTWHHHEIVGFMESVITANHETKKGQPSHTGGVFFWEIIHNKVGKYK